MRGRGEGWGATACAQGPQQGGAAARKELNPPTHPSTHPPPGLPAGEHNVPKDPSRAVKLLRRGVDMNDAESCFELGKLFEEGRGVARSIADAEKLYRRCVCVGGGGGGCPTS